MKTIVNYTAIFERELEGGFHVYCPALKGCHSQGETYEEALENITEAVEVYLESLADDGEAPPEDNVIVQPLQVAV